MGALGIIAGAGALPGRIMARCREMGRPYVVYGFLGQTDRPLNDGDPVSDICAHISADHWFRLGAGGHFLKTLKSDDIEQVVLAGRFLRPSLTDLRPDFVMAKLLTTYGPRLLGDDSTLRVVADILEKNGQHIVSAEHIMGSDLLASPGVMGHVTPAQSAILDIKRGFDVARALGAVDVGQSVIVQNGLVLGVEGAEGTDGLIARCLALRRPGPGGVLVKILKPGQDTRFDRPTVGPTTVLMAGNHGLSGIAVESGAVIVLDLPAMAAAADRMGLFLWGFDPNTMGKGHDDAI